MDEAEAQAVKVVEREPTSVSLCLTVADGETVLFNDTIGEPLWLIDMDGDAVYDGAIDRVCMVEIV